MKIMRKLFTFTTLLTLIAAPGFSQESYSDESQAYMDCADATYMSVVIPVGALGLASIAIAATSRTHSDYSHAGSGTLSRSSKSNRHSSSSSSSFAHH